MSVLITVTVDRNKHRFFKAFYVLYIFIVLFTDTERCIINFKRTVFMKQQRKHWKKKRLTNKEKQFF